MIPFLKVVADDLLKKYGNNLSRVAVIFPNKRAGIFLNEYLARQSATPVWSPAYFSISELFQNLTKFRTVDQIGAVCQLYKVYKDNLPEIDESLDKFYGWGEVMLKDFDDIDKSLADADSIFQNVSDLRALEDSHYLTKEQEEALRKFFADFSVESNTQLKKRFLTLWNKMAVIYHQYKELLIGNGELYEGALCRYVIEKTTDEQWSSLLRYEKYVFVGFNYLSQVQEKLFRKVKSCDKALFYWDFDHYYVSKNLNSEAGRFIRENMLRFPNALDDKYYDNLLINKEITVIESASDNAQTRYIPEWLKQHCTPKESETAVVLCDEGLLQPILHVLPTEITTAGGERHVRNVNLTMGFPMSNTPVVSYLSVLLDLQTNGYDAGTKHFHKTEVEAVKNHPYYKIACTCLKAENEDNNTIPDYAENTNTEESLILKQVNGNLELLDYLTAIIERIALIYKKNQTDKKGKSDALEQLYVEALFRAHSILARFHSLVETGILTVEMHTMKRLLTEVLKTTSIPFHGEPAVGLQVMGLMETRNLDFRNIIMLSVNEGMLPKSTNDTSFIPYALRLHFGLTIIDHDVALYAFTFYRLLQRCEHITLLYNASTEGTKVGEMSRFVRQLKVETNLPIKCLSLQPAQLNMEDERIVIEKDNSVMAKLHEIYDVKNDTHRFLSPSAINSYLKCPLIFYFDQVAGIRPEQQPEEQVDASTFGLIFHESAQRIYELLIQNGPEIRASDIERCLKDKDSEIERILDNAFYKHYFSKISERWKANRPKPLPYTGLNLLVRKVIRIYLKQLLMHDMKLCPFSILALEDKNSRIVEVKTPSETFEVEIGGVIDRIDKVNPNNEAGGSSLPTLRIVDYKTGGRPQSAESMEKLFIPSKSRPGYLLQTFLYASTLSVAMQNDKSALPKETSKTQDALNERMPIAPALFFVNKSASDDYSPYIEFGPVKDKEKVLDFQNLEPDFLAHLQVVLSEIFNPQVPFSQTHIEESCAHCNYRLLCKKHD